MRRVALLRCQDGGVQGVAVGALVFHPHIDARMSVVVVGHHALDEQFATTAESMPEVDHCGAFGDGFWGRSLSDRGYFDDSGDLNLFDLPGRSWGWSTASYKGQQHS